MPNSPATPFYFDWTFWSFVAAAIAIVLSQLPPIRTLWHRPALRFDLYGRILVTHMLGYPNVGAVVGLRNSGTKSVRVTSVEAVVSRDGKQRFVLRGFQYYPEHTSTSTVVFTPVTVEPNSEWIRSFEFVEELDRAEDRSLGRMRADYRHHLAEKWRAAKEADPESEPTVDADEDMLAAVLAVFNKKFAWEAGDYEFQLVAHCDDGTKTYGQRQRFLLHESDTAELRKHCDGYRQGYGVALDRTTWQKAIIVPVSAA